MRIVQVSPARFSRSGVTGGGERYVNYLSRSLVDAVGGCCRITELYGGPREEFEVESPRLERLVFEANDANVSHVLANAIERVVDGDTAVVVHQGLSQFGLHVAARSRLAGARRVIGFDHGGGEDDLVWRNPSLAGLFDTMVAQSRFAAECMSGLDVPIVTILGPIDDSLYRPNPVARQARTALVVGRILPHKGLEHVIKGLSGDWTIRIVGQSYDDEYFEYLRNTARTSAATVEFHGRASDEEVQELYQLSALGLQWSQWRDFRGRWHPKTELLGLAPLEAVASGLPVLVSGAGALGELAALVGVKISSNDRLEVDAVRHSDSVWDPHVMHASVSASYGLASFGESLFNVVAGVTDA